MVGKEKEKVGEVGPVVPNGQAFPGVVCVSLELVSDSSCSSSSSDSAWDVLLHSINFCGS